MSTKLHWDLEQIIGDAKAIPALRRRQSTALKKFLDARASAPRWKTDPAALKRALDELSLFEEQFGTWGAESYYWSLRQALNQNDPKVKAGLHHSSEHSRALADQLRPWQLELAKLPKSDQKRMLSAPILKSYRQFLRRAFAEGAHLLSAPEEAIAASLVDTSYIRWTDLTDSLLVKEPIPVGAKKMTLPEAMSATNDPDATKRRQAGEAITAFLARWRDVAEGEINALLAFKQTDDRLRGYKTPEDSRFQSDNVDAAMVEVMSAAVERSYPLAHRFYRLKAQILGVKKLAYYERSIVGQHKSKQVSLDAALTLVRGVFKRLDPEFEQITNGFIANHTIDSEPKAGRNTGAFCSYGLKSNPTYILLNHTNELRDVLTIAHELGHGINDELMRQAQPALYFATSTATAEVASTFMEDFVLEELKQDATPAERLDLLLQQLNDQVSTIFRQIAFFRFEQALHQKFRTQGFVSADEIGILFKHELGRYLGPAVDVTDAGDWWIYVGHFRRFFYVYSYASGLLISKALQALVREDASFISEVKTFLKTGTSASPRETFKRLGLDITKPAIWEKGLGEFASLLTEAEQLARELEYTKGKK